MKKTPTILAFLLLYIYPVFIVYGIFLKARLKLFFEYIHSKKTQPYWFDKEQHVGFGLRTGTGKRAVKGNWHAGEIRFLEFSPAPVGKEKQPSLK